MDERRVHKTWYEDDSVGSILQEADKIINGERRGDYGSPLQSFTTIAQLWGPVLGIEVTPIQVALCMEQLKVARFLNGQDRDSAVDGAGYWGCIELMMREMMANKDCEAGPDEPRHGFAPTPVQSTTQVRATTQ